MVEEPEPRFTLMVFPAHTAVCDAEGVIELTVPPVTGLMVTVNAAEVSVLHVLLSLIIVLICRVVEVST